MILQTHSKNCRAIWSHASSLERPSGGFLNVLRKAITQFVQIGLVNFFLFSRGSQRLPNTPQIGQAAPPFALLAK